MKICARRRRSCSLCYYPPLCARLPLPRHNWKFLDFSRTTVRRAWTAASVVAPSTTTGAAFAPHFFPRRARRAPFVPIKYFPKGTSRVDTIVETGGDESHSRVPVEFKWATLCAISRRFPGCKRARERMSFYFFKPFAHSVEYFHNSENIWRAITFARCARVCNVCIRMSRVVTLMVIFQVRRREAVN